MLFTEQKANRKVTQGNAQKTLWPWCSSELHSYTQMNKIYSYWFSPMIWHNCVPIAYETCTHIHTTLWGLGMRDAYTSTTIIFATGSPHTWFIITIKNKHFRMASYIFFYIQPGMRKPIMQFIAVGTSILSTFSQITSKSISSNSSDFYCLAKEYKYHLIGY